MSILTIVKQGPLLSSLEHRLLKERVAALKSEIQELEEAKEAVLEQVEEMTRSMASFWSTCESWYQEAEEAVVNIQADADHTYGLQQEIGIVESELESIRDRYRSDIPSQSKSKGKKSRYGVMRVPVGPLKKTPSKKPSTV